VFERYVARIRRVTGGGGEQVICGLLPIRRVMSNKLKKIKDGYITEARKMTKGKFWLWFARIATVEAQGTQSRRDNKCGEGEAIG